MSILDPYLAYIKWGAIALLLAGCIGGGWWMRGKVCEANAAKDLKAQSDSYRKTVEYWQKQAYATDEKLQAALKAQPKTGQTVREVIRNAPSTCTVAPAVTRKLRDGIQAANEAAGAR